MKKTIFWLAMILLIIAAAVNCYIHLPKNDTFVPVPREEKTLLQLWIDDLEIYECKNCPPNFKRIDSNGLYSYSCLQFQKPTFVSYVKRYNLLPYAEAADYDNMIYDCDFQKKLAELMILDNYKNYQHWQTSINRGLGFPPK